MERLQELHLVPGVRTIRKGFHVGLGVSFEAMTNPEKLACFRGINGMWSSHDGSVEPEEQQ